MATHAPTLNQPESNTTADFLPLKGTDHVEFYVGNARQAAYFYRAAFGMSLVAYAGPETGQRDRASYVLQQGKVRFVLTTALRSDTEIARHVHTHGDGVRAIALWVDDARQAWHETTKRGARSVQEPTDFSDDHGRVTTSSIAAYGDTVHTFVERTDYKGAFFPGYHAVKHDHIARPVGLLHIDHIVGNVGWNSMNQWVDFYRDVMGFGLYQHFDDNDISTEYSALMSKVMANGNGYVKFPINEPAEGRRKSQIEEYLDFYGGPGVQHMALATNDILATVAAMKQQGVDFLTVPHSYYTELQTRIGKIDEPIHELEKLGILVDRDNEGYMLQIFTKPVEDRPTVFYEIIQRKGSRSFGKGNFKALFEAIEREQELRGNL
ncbi:4-hydroxyphenylpyruvate dioxygenase [Tunturiibacter lichenicola]|uniref:4-hydroxyphenylpyruvate dioxygenase n=1 Tax=Tunturiibacter lichenicola TaxID=2051959 RepID=UPI0021B4249C|nr:4-hydroxyphenylpyruvate dioxygenase [Edaphobacter lichenicola]